MDVGLRTDPGLESEWRNLTFTGEGPRDAELAKTLRGE